MSGFHNEHLISDVDYVGSETGECKAVKAICNVCKEDVSWILNRN